MNVDIPCLPGYYVSIKKDTKKIEIFNNINNIQNINKNNYILIEYSIIELLKTVWVLSKYYLEEYILFLPKSTELNSIIYKFNAEYIIDKEYYLLDIPFIESSIENFNNLSLKKEEKKKNLLIFSGDILHSLSMNNKKRVSTILNYPFKRVFLYNNIFIPILYPKFKNNNINFEYIITDTITLQFLNELPKDKKCVLFTDSPKKINVPGLYINDYSNDYSLIIIKIKNVDPIIRITNCLCKGVPIYIDEYSMDLIDSFQRVNEIIKFKDSQSQFDSYEECVNNINNKEIILASEEYYLINPSNKILSLDLSNLTRQDLSVIRNIVISFFLKNDIIIKTCQMATPSNNILRSKKLNSLANKVNSSDYLCNVTCEVFRDYSIGVVLWTELFSDKKQFDISLLKGNTYIYQKTNGKWTYSYSLHSEYSEYPECSGTG
jgi:hypothetical protein